MTAAGVFRDRLQLVLMLAVGAAAACNSWSHVLQLAADHGQTGWHSWAVAACIETAAVSAGLEMDRRRRAGQDIRVAVAVLVGSVVLQLAAQLAVAEATIWGWIVAAVPAVTFLVLAKLAISRSGHPIAAPEPLADPIAFLQADPIEPAPVDPIEAGRNWASADRTLVSALAPTRPRRATVKIERPPARGLLELQAALIDSIRAGHLPDRPAADPIRKHLRIAPSTARELRDWYALQPSALTE